MDIALRAPPEYKVDADVGLSIRSSLRDACKHLCGHQRLSPSPQICSDKGCYPHLMLRIWAAENKSAHYGHTRFQFRFPLSIWAKVRANGHEQQWPSPGSV